MLQQKKNIIKEHKRQKCLNPDMAQIPSAKNVKPKNDTTTMDNLGKCLLFFKNLYGIFNFK